MQFESQIDFAVITVFDLIVVMFFGFDLIYQRYWYLLTTSKYFWNYFCNLVAFSNNLVIFNTSESSK